MDKEGGREEHTGLRLDMIARRPVILLWQQQGQFQWVKSERYFHGRHRQRWPADDLSRGEAQVYEKLDFGGNTVHPSSGNKIRE